MPGTEALTQLTVGPQLRSANTLLIAVCVGPLPAHTRLNTLLLPPPAAATRLVVWQFVPVSAHGVVAPTPTGNAPGAYAGYHWKRKSPALDSGDSITSRK